MILTLQANIARTLAKLIFFYLNINPLPPLFYKKRIFFEPKSQKTKNKLTKLNLPKPHYTIDLRNTAK
jgi:hypothetical protein